MLRGDATRSICCPFQHHGQPPHTEAAAPWTTPVRWVEHGKLLLTCPESNNHCRAFISRQPQWFGADCLLQALDGWWLPTPVHIMGALPGRIPQCDVASLVNYWTRVPSKGLMDSPRAWNWITFGDFVDPPTPQNNVSSPRYKSALTLPFALWRGDPRSPWSEKCLSLAIVPPWSLFIFLPPFHPEPWSKQVSQSVSQSVSREWKRNEKKATFNWITVSGVVSAQACRLCPDMAKGGLTICTLLRKKPVENVMCFT